MVSDFLCYIKILINSCYVSDFCSYAFHPAVIPGPGSSPGSPRMTHLWEAYSWKPLNAKIYAYYQLVTHQGYSISGTHISEEPQLKPGVVGHSEHHHR